jgi:hypothetical protein
MKIVTLIAALLIGTIFFLNAPVFADTYELKEWWCTIEKLEISKNGGLTWFTVFEGGSTPLNMVGNPAAPTGDGSVPAGSYNKGRVHVIYNKFVIEYDDGVNGASNVYDGLTGNAYIEDYDDISQEDPISVNVSANGTTNAYIDFDPSASLTSCTAIWDGAKYVVTDMDFEPVISVHE